MSRWGYIVFALLAGMVGQGCSSRAIHEAEAVVAQADSLWQAGLMYGTDAGDSLTLAQAYETLKEHSAFSRQLSEVCPFVPCTSLLRTYAHSCYHYGKLLRAKDNPVEAMQAFINATHSRTHDYHILGRVYSNMGSICHLAGDFPLSYDMYEKSADMFLQNGDTLAYYYGLNNMAFEKAMLADKVHVIALTNTIEEECSDTEVFAKVLETKAELYLREAQYDSARYFAKELCRIHPSHPLGLLVQAQSFSFTGQKDSATYYAEKVLAYATDKSEIHNALYILTNDDERRDKNAIREVAAKRSDIQKQLKMVQSKLSKSVSLLEQDHPSKPDWQWLYTMIATIIVIGSCLLLYIHRKRNQHKLLSQQVDDLTSRTIAMQVKNEELSQSYSNNYNQIKEDIDHKCALLQDSGKIKKTLAWKNYHTMCTIVDKQFYLLASKLQSKQLLNETEIRLCILTLLDCGYDQMAELLYYAPNGIGKLKLRVAKKLGTSAKGLRSYLIENECVR